LASSKRPAAPAPPLTLTAPLLPHENISNQHDTTPKQVKIEKQRREQLHKHLTQKQRRKQKQKRNQTEAIK